MWSLSWRFDPVTRELADRHYNRQKVGTAQFVPPGRCLVLRTDDAAAFWITSWPFGEYVRHRWPGAWVCSAFRNEDRERYLSSALIIDALKATRWKWGGAPPDLGMVSFIDRDKTRRKRDPGRCFIRAGFEYDGETEGGLVAVRMRAEALAAIPAEAPHGAQMSLGGVQHAEVPR